MEMHVSTQQDFWVEPTVTLRKGMLSFQISLSNWLMQHYFNLITFHEGSGLFHFQGVLVTALHLKIWGRVGFWRRKKNYITACLLLL